MKNNLFAICGKKPRHILMISQETDEIKPTVPEVNMILELEKTDYGGQIALAQITHDHPDFEGFMVACVDQQNKVFKAPAIMFEPKNGWPITAQDLDHHLKQIFHGHFIKFTTDKLPVKRVARITITEVK